VNKQSLWIIYSIGNSLNRGILFLVPLWLIAFCTPEDVGLFSLINSAIFITGLVFSWGLRQVLTIEYFNSNDQEKGELVLDLLLLGSVVTIPVMLFILLFWRSCNMLLFSDSLHSLLFFLVVLLICFCTSLIEFFYQVLLFEKKIIQLLVLQLVPVVGMVTGLLLVRTGHVECIFYGQLSGFLVVLLCIAYEFMVVRKEHAISIPRLKKRFYYCLPLGMCFLPALLGAWVLNVMGRWFLMYYYGCAMVGFYTIVDCFNAAFNTVIIAPIAAIYVPQALKQLSQTVTIIQEDKKIIRDMALVMVGLTVVCAGLCGFNPLVQHFLPVRYHYALSYAWVALLGQILFMGTYFATCLLQIRKRAIVLSGSLIAAAVINVIGMMILVPRYAIAGAVSASVLAYSAYFCIVLWFHYREYRNIMEK
jgi:O-antigen/teichoic acid export membrane protein